MARLRNELDAAAGSVAADDKKDNDVEGIPLDQLDKLPFLNAVMCVSLSHDAASIVLTASGRNETLRLRLVIPDGVPRTPPPDGGPAVVGSQYVSLLISSAPMCLRLCSIIPVGTTVQIPTYSRQSPRAATAARR
jgi:hypothetical protein